MIIYYRKNLLYYPLITHLIFLHVLSYHYKQAADLTRFFLIPNKFQNAKERTINPNKKIPNPNYSFEFGIWNLEFFILEFYA